MRWRVTTPSYTEAEWYALRQLHRRYQQDRDLWTAREVAHLRFLRWLVETGRLIPGGNRGEKGSTP